MLLSSAVSSFQLRMANSGMDMICQEAVKHLNPGPTKKFAFDSAKTAVKEALEKSTKEAAAKKILKEGSDDVAKEVFQAFIKEGSDDVLHKVAEGRSICF